MGKRTSYAPGTFSWVDLATTDAAAAKAFYTGLFGWETEDTDAGGGAVYTLCRLDGDAVAGLYEMSAGAPPNWLSYITTDDADAARAFYEGAFGWTTDRVDTGPGGPLIVAARNGETLNASASEVAGGAPAHWRPYFTVESTEQALERVSELGGGTLFGPLPIPGGSLAIAHDPQGAVFALFEGETDP